MNFLARPTGLLMSATVQTFNHGLCQTFQLFQTLQMFQMFKRRSDRANLGLTIGTLGTIETIAASNVELLNG
jgi:hypothetical protein